MPTESSRIARPPFSNRYFNEQTDPRGGIYEGEREQWEMKKFLDEKVSARASAAPAMWILSNRAELLAAPPR